ncbi:MAG: hypothetical protein GY861_06180 [bacterium]|nr:hypothetical protein [bacterium]
MKNIFEDNPNLSSFSISAQNMPSESTKTTCGHILLACLPEFDFVHFISKTTNGKEWKNIQILFLGAGQAE